MTRPEVESAEAFTSRLLLGAHDYDSALPFILARDAAIRAEALMTGLRERAGELRGRAAGGLDPGQRKFVEDGWERDAQAENAGKNCVALAFEHLKAKLAEAEREKLRWSGIADHAEKMLQILAREVEALESKLAEAERKLAEVTAERDMPCAHRLEEERLRERVGVLEEALRPLATASMVSSVRPVYVIGARFGAPYDQRAAEAMVQAARAALEGSK